MGNRFLDGRGAGALGALKAGCARQPHSARRVERMCWATPLSLRTFHVSNNPDIDSPGTDMPMLSERPPRAAAKDDALISLLLLLQTASLSALTPHCRFRFHLCFHFPFPSTLADTSWQACGWLLRALYAAHLTTAPRQGDAIYGVGDTCPPHTINVADLQLAGRLSPVGGQINECELSAHC
eukprot:361414-Chlamydomonas_euryale.AAC.2